MPQRNCQKCGQPLEGRTSKARHCYGACYRAFEAEKTKERRATWSVERRRAGHLVQSAIQSGALKRQPCEVCGDTRFVDAHHDDYSKPLDVRWLCRSHHRLHHVRARAS